MLPCSCPLVSRTGPDVSKQLRFAYVDPPSDGPDLGRVNGALVASVRASPPWGLDLPPRPAFHAITSGTAWAEVEGSEPLQLMPGDVLLLPAGARQQLFSEPHAASVPFDSATKERLMTTDGDLTLGASGAVTAFVCAAVDYDLDDAALLMCL